MDNETLKKIDEFFESLNAHSGLGQLSWATVTIKGAKVLMASDSLGVLDLRDLAQELNEAH